MTETAGIISAQPLDGRFRPAAAGFPAPGVEVRIGPPDAAEQPHGEIYVRGPNVFAGYCTASGMVGTPGGWVATGDLGKFDKDGQLHLLGRSKDVIIRGAHNIDPLMIEDAALTHPHILQAAAIPFPDKYAGELPVLYIAPRGGKEVSDSDILAFVCERIADPPARPKRIFVLSELPLTPIGKVARFKLRQAAAQTAASEALSAFPIESILCLDPAGKRLVIGWRKPLSAADLAVAVQILGELGLTL